MKTTEDFKTYYAVIFTSTLKTNAEGYHEMAEKMEALAKLQPGFLGIDSARNSVGITICYWESIDAIIKWKQQSEYLTAQEKGKTDWYSLYNVKICKVEREYSLSALQ